MQETDRITKAECQGTITNPFRQTYTTYKKIITHKHNVSYPKAIKPMGALMCSMGVHVSNNVSN